VGGHLGLAARVCVEKPNARHGRPTHRSRSGIANMIDVLSYSGRTEVLSRRLLRVPMLAMTLPRGYTLSEVLCVAGLGALLAWLRASDGRGL
jgi:hypothetical protein